MYVDGVVGLHLVVDKGRMLGLCDDAKVLECIRVEELVAKERTDEFLDFLGVITAQAVEGSAVFVRGDIAPLAQLKQGARLDHLGLGPSSHPQHICPGVDAMCEDLVQGVVRLGSDKDRRRVGLPPIIDYHGLDCFDGRVRLAGSWRALHNGELLGDDTMQSEKLGLVEPGQIAHIRNLVVDDVVRLQFRHDVGVVLSGPGGKRRDVHDGIFLEEIGVCIAGTVPD